MAVSFINSAFREWMQWKTMWYICDTKWTEQTEWMNERTYERTCRYSSAINTNTRTHMFVWMWVCMQPYERFMEHVSLFRSVCVRPCVCVCVRVWMCEAHCAIEKRKEAITGSCHIICSARLIHTNHTLRTMWRRWRTHVNNMLLLFGCSLAAVFMGK